MVQSADVWTPTSMMLYNNLTLCTEEQLNYSILILVAEYVKLDFCSNDVILFVQFTRINIFTIQWNLSIMAGHPWGTTLWPLYRGGCSSGVLGF